MGAWDHLLSVLHLYPFRCQLCAARFRAFQARHYSHRGDRREYDRLLARVPVTLTSGAGHADGETVHLSLTGCSVRTDGAFPPGSSVQMRLRLGQAGDVTVESAVVRTQREGGVGLQFARMAAGDRARLSRYLDRFLRPSGTARRRPGLPRPEVLLAAAVGALVIIMVFMLLSRVGAPLLR
ncbi:MAG TPA: PilZ domain-containing protein [Methylomirabilota bacterium]|nr:PilZ domain-containing protein [Methylomirabilota bacterium]